MEYKHELQRHNFVKLLNCTFPFKISDETRSIRKKITLSFYN